LFLGQSCDTLVQTNLDHWLDAVDPAWAGEDRLLLSSVERRTAAMELCVSSCTTARSENDLTVLWTYMVWGCRMAELLASWGSAPSHSEEEGKGAIGSVVIDGHGVEVVADTDTDRDSGARSEAADDEARPARVVEGEELARWMRVLTTPPVLNPATLYTTIMSASLSTGAAPIPDDDEDEDEDEKDDRSRQKKEGDTISRGVYLSVGVTVTNCS
jgi:hypothetical protein